MSYQPKDVHINIGWHDGSRKDIAPDGPGWYVDVREMEGYRDITPRTRITSVSVLGIARLIDEAVKGRKPNPHFDHPPGSNGCGYAPGVEIAVERAVAETRRWLEHTIERAEREAAKAADLRERLAQEYPEECR